MSLISESYNIQWQILFSHHLGTSACPLGCRLGALPIDNTIRAPQGRREASKKQCSGHAGVIVLVVTLMIELGSVRFRCQR